MSFDSQRPGLPWSSNRGGGGTAHRPLSSLLSSSKSLIKLSVEDSSTPSIGQAILLKLPDNVHPNVPPRVVRLPRCQFLLCDPFISSSLLTHFAHAHEGALVFGEVFEKPNQALCLSLSLSLTLSPSTFSQLLTAA